MVDVIEKRGKLFVISGPSAAGKGTLCKKLIEANDSLELSVSMTTRKPRTGEVEGINYYFTTVEDFQNRIEEGKFLEFAKVYDNYYGTPKDMVVEKLKEGKDVILEIDTQGALNVKKSYPDGILIFILPPSLKELKHRIILRGTESEDAIRLRMSKSMEEINQIREYDYAVVNDDLERATSQLRNIILAEHSRVGESVKDIISRYKEEI